MKKILIIIFINFIILNCYSKKIELKVDDKFLKKYFKEYPSISIFKIDYLDFFADQSKNEKELSIKNNVKYILIGDFNKNGKEEIAITGLLSTKIENNKLDPFIVIFEKENNDYKIIYFQNLLKILIQMSEQFKIYH